MQISFTFRQFEASEDLKDLIRSRLQAKLGKFRNGTDMDVKVTIESEKAWTYVDMLVNAFGEVFKCRVKTADEVNPAIEGVIDKLERQLLKKKGLFEGRRRRAG